METRDKDLQSTSFPIMYSHGPQKSPVPDVFQSRDTSHRFIDRKSLVGKEHQGTPSNSDLVIQSKRGTSDELSTPPFREKPLVKDPTSDSDEMAFRASKYQRLPAENCSNQQGSTPQLEHSLHLEEVGIDPVPHWRIAMTDSLSPTSSQSNQGRLPLLRAESLTAKSREQIELVGQCQRVAVLRPHVCTGNVSSQADVTSETATSMQEANTAGPTSGPKFCKICKCVLYGEDESMGIRPEDKVWFEVTIQDPGVGIGKEQLNRLFVGSQAGSQRINASGTGLGLAICKGLLCLMNGKVQMESKIGEGTTVIVTVPLLPAAEAVQELVESVSRSDTSSLHTIHIGVQKPTVSDSRIGNPIAEARSETKTTESNKEKPKPKGPETKATEPSKEKIKVLVAEDNRVNQLLIRKMFQHLGHQVEIVGNGKLALEAVQRANFDLVLMDVQMPILDGLSATKAIRALSSPASEIPIYALSADTPGSGPMEETGLDGYLKKPIAWDTMSQLIAQIQAAKDKIVE